MNCPNCGAAGSFDDNFCPRCGAIKRSRLPVRREQSPPPALWQAAAPMVARGAALVAAGLLGEWLLRSATRRAVTAPIRAKKRLPARAVARREEAPARTDGVVAVSETVVVRRVILRGR